MFLEAEDVVDEGGGRYIPEEEGEKGNTCIRTPLQHAQHTPQQHSTAHSTVHSTAYSTGQASSQASSLLDVLVQLEKAEKAEHAEVLVVLIDPRPGHGLGDVEGYDGEEVGEGVEGEDRPEPRLYGAFTYGVFKVVRRCIWGV